MKTHMMFAVVALVAGCGVGGKQEVDEDLSGVVLDAKSDAPGSTRVLGALKYGQTSASALYTKTPLYRAYTFAGKKGDKVDIWVRGSTGDAITWLLDDNSSIVAQNDDASSSVWDSHIIATLKLTGTHYIVYRDYYQESRYFKVTLAGTTSGTTDLYGCTRDADCEKTFKGCCNLNAYVGVKKGSVAAYRASQGCSANPICPAIAIREDFSVAQCNTSTNKCEIVQPEDIACNAFTTNPHSCPTGWACEVPADITDVPGECFQRCGGSASTSCSQENHSCVSGLCKPDCRQTGCAAGRYCSFCWGGYACIPNNAIC
jgi:hypothetical protein